MAAPIAAIAQESPIGSIGTSLKDTPAPVRELAICIWQSNQNAAMRLSSQEMAQWQNKTPHQYSLRPTDLDECGGQPELSYALKNIESLAINLHLIRLNQTARCVVKNKNVRITDLFAKLLIDNQARFPGRFATLGADTKLEMALSTGVRLPQELLTAVATCDPGVGAWADLDSYSRPLLATELTYEAKRNA